MAHDILVVAEHENGVLRRGTFEALGLARTLAGALGVRACAVVLGGPGTASLAAELADRGADEAFAIEDPLLATYTPGGYRTALVGLVRDLQPEWVLAAHTYQAQDFLPQASAAFDAPVISDAVDCQPEAAQVVFVRQPYDAKYVARTVDTGPAPHFATLQSGQFSADALPAGGHGGTVTARAAGVAAADLGRTVKEIRATSAKTVDLSAAPVIVAGGRGLGSKEKFQEVVGGLATALGGVVGASRPVVDAEWLPHEYQIGSSGQAVAPKLYVALGISGAIQHVVGIRGAQCIVAINKDKDAPIFNESTYGLVGDLNEIVPELLKALQG